MPSKSKIVANMENYTISDKIGAMQDIILEKENMIIVWGYVLAAYKSVTFARTVLHH